MLSAFLSMHLNLIPRQEVEEFLQLLVGAGSDPSGILNLAFSVCVFGLFVCFLLHFRISVFKNWLFSSLLMFSITRSPIQYLYLIGRQQELAFCVL